MRAQPLSAGAMHDRIYGPICGSIHHHGIQNSGGPPKAAPTVLEAAEGCPIQVNGATCGTINPIMHASDLERLRPHCARRSFKKLEIVTVALVLSCNGAFGAIGQASLQHAGATTYTVEENI